MRPSFAHTFHTSVNSRPVGFFRQAASDGPVCACPHVRRVSCLAPLPPRRSKACPCREPRGARHFSTSDRFLPPRRGPSWCVSRYGVLWDLSPTGVRRLTAERDARLTSYFRRENINPIEVNRTKDCVLSLDYSSPAPSNSPTQFSGDANNT